MRQKNSATDALCTQPSARVLDALDRIREYRGIVVGEPGVGLLHRHLDGQRGIAGIGEAGAQCADHPVIRMHAHTVHE